MSKLTPYDAFETKKYAIRLQKSMKRHSKYPVQYVQIKRTTGRLKWTVYIGGKNSRYW
jgi:hypothetical protein